MNIEITQQLGDEAWDAFCLQQGGNVFQSPHFARICRDTRDCRVYPFFALADGKPVASVLFTEIRQYSALPGAVSTRLVCYGGALWEQGSSGEEAVAALLTTVLRAPGLPAHLFLEVRNFQDTGPIRTHLESLGLQYVPYLNYLLNLTLPETALWEHLSKEKRRKIRRAERNGLSLRESRDAADLDWFYRLLARRYREKGVPLVDRSHFQTHFQAYSQQGLMRLFLVEHKQQPIAGVIVLVYGGKAYEWYAASDPAFHRLRPNEWRVWKVVQILRSEGVTLYDFCGAGYPDQPYGVRQFKKTFGGREVEWGRYLYLPRPGLYRVLMQLYRWRQKMAEKGL